MAYAYAVDPKTSLIQADPFGPYGVANPYDPIAKTRNTSTAPPDLADAGPQTSDTLAQILAELRAQAMGDPSPRTRDLQMQMLGGGR